jgi:hypothetical protein
VMVFGRQGQDRTDAPQPAAQARRETAAPPAPVVPETSTPIAAAAPEPIARRERREATSSASVTVLNAQVCRVLERVGAPDWQCTPATGDVWPPGTYTFYTRLLTTTATTVEHRWYRNDRVHQTMRLRVSASSGSGFRTFSVTTVSPERAGEWKVELRAPDGTLLDHASFLVR